MNSPSVCMTTEDKFVDGFSGFFPFKMSKKLSACKNLGMGAIIDIKQANFAIALITPAVFPFGKIAVNTAESNTVPTIQSKYPLKTTPPTKPPTTEYRENT